MASPLPSESADQDWRLQAELAGGDAHRSLPGLLERLRARRELVKEVESGLAHDVVITHDGSLLFAYAFTQQALAGARNSIEAVLREDGIDASIRVGHWDDEHDRWQQIDPPPSAEEQGREEVLEREEDALETRTMVASSGRLVRAEFEQTMRDWAAKLGLQCAVVEHPHLLATQVAFTVTGSRHKIDQFAKGLRAEGWAMVRTETGIMASPL